MTSKLVIGAGTASLVSNIVFNKWILLFAAGFIIYITGGFDVISNNPTLVVLAGLMLLVVLFKGNRR